jgi:hypothetical protein
MRKAKTMLQSTLASFVWEVDLSSAASFARQITAGHFLTRCETRWSQYLPYKVFLLSKQDILGGLEELVLMGQIFLNVTHGCEMCDDSFSLFFREGLA